MQEAGNKTVISIVYFLKIYHGLTFKKANSRYHLVHQEGAA